MTGRAQQASVIKLLIWTGIPTHHQNAFFEALRRRGIDLVVHYYNRVPAARLRLGWAEPDRLPDNERYVRAGFGCLEKCGDWRERIHVVPGCGTVFLMALSLYLSLHGVRWVHWSEPSRPSRRRRSGDMVRWIYARLINRRALGALAIGEMARRDFIRWGVRAERIHFLPYSIQGLTVADMPRPVVAENCVRFLFLGVLCPRKATDVLLDAFAHVTRTSPEARLDLVGYDQSNGGYAQQARRLGIDGAVSFLGSVPVARLPEAIARCDVLVLPSRFDGWGVVVNEAVSMGKAVIATDMCGAAHHLIVESVNGYRVAAENAAELADRMLRYCWEPSLIAAHGRASKQLFLDFTPERNALRLVEALRQMGVDHQAREITGAAAASAGS